MKQQKVVKKLDKFFEENSQILERIAIYEIAGGYCAFKDYNICKEAGEWKVTKNNNPCGTFNTVKNAMSWCIADKYSQTKLRDEISELVNKRHSVAIDLDVRSKIAKKLSKNNTSIEDKVQSRRYQLDAIDFRLDKCSNLAKYWQIQGFIYETARSGRTSPYRTN